MGLELNVSQVQTLSPQVIQSLEILQMNSQELVDYVQRLTQENPVIELENARGEVQQEHDLIRRRMEWMEMADRQNRWYIRQDAGEEMEEDRKYDGQQQEEMLLSAYIRSQLESGDPEFERAVVLLTESLNENGWLEDDLTELAQESGISQMALQQALEAIQQTEPAGVGARNLRECLLLQLRRLPQREEVAERIASDYLEDLAKNHYNHIAKALRISQTQVRQGVEVIRSLNPRPGNGFAKPQQTLYIVPDIIAIPFEDHYELLTNDAMLPRLNISGYYTRLLQESDDESVRTYLDEKVRQAKWAVSAIDQRRETMIRCMEAMMELQPDYFKKGSGPIRPMTLARVAEKVGVHESTISRAIRGKYLQCPEGVLPLNHFFSQEVPQHGDGGEELSVQEAKQRLKALLLAEDPAKPLSDQKLRDLLEEGGCVLARRTVAKYRTELGFLPATGRKKG